MIEMTPQKEEEIIQLELDKKETELLKNYVQNKWKVHFSQIQQLFPEDQSYTSDQCYELFMCSLGNLVKNNPDFKVIPKDESHYYVTYKHAYNFLMIEYYKEFGVITFYIENLQKQNEIMRFSCYEYNCAVNAIIGTIRSKHQSVTVEQMYICSTVHITTEDLETYTITFYHSGINKWMPKFVELLNSPCKFKSPDEILECC